MKRLAQLSTLTMAFATAALIAAPASRAQNQGSLYDGTEAAASRGIIIRGWGSGQAVEVRDRVLSGQQFSARIRSDGPYSGGRFIFNTPVDLGGALKGPESDLNFLQFSVQFEPSPLANRQPGTSGAPGDSGGAILEPNSGGAVSQPLPGFPGDPGAVDPLTGQPAKPLQASKLLRVAMVFDDGKTIEASRWPISLYPVSGDPGWFQMAVPFKAFSGRDKLTSGKLKEVRIFTDNKDTFYVGDIQIVHDDEPIVIEPLDNFDVAVGDIIQFDAQAQGGLSTLKYSWDFDAKDGVQEDAVGQSVIKIYRKERTKGNGEPEPYIVTLTVTDVSGAKKPEVQKCEVVVNP